MRPAKRNSRLGWSGALFGATIAGLAGCANDRGPYPDLPLLSVQAQFTSRNLCSLGVSPEIILAGTPSGAATYRWRMTNVSVLRAPPWQVDVPAVGGLIAEDAAANFPAPCIGELERPGAIIYRFEIMALTADGRPLAYGWSFVGARSLSYQVDLEQQQAAGRIPKPERRVPTAGTAGSRPSFFLY